ncbi:DUF3742 family protein [Halopseudomonas pachastrellae]|jgi:uncharacterized protein DUF3742|uniref:DUF3742 family protein n=1 Tax=Alloalcanivorax xenomutans TaxID=1094342 RepID=A0A9Q3W752_9GAMM|nr:DUF3742 family protein [Alloalcanivorax xenomutans]MBA4721425.1 DUF3742 family protein [Alcanivorax sp.]MCE7510130.1 DUF3742 family protein [Alloalcanivorax xenomutans]MCE7525710.1 DUF3742 family protein [Alloalcanivorax xenomutans]MEB3733707.1 DUF3742 family protein [Halopseudomonas pachastrellae]|tara:strand:+ start:4483 stop:4842 length:360 start_codon:yes stop_codon:yes gene_type:complete
MKATPTITKTERAGRWLGLAWRSLTRQESRAIQWLAKKGLPEELGKVLFWSVKLVVLGVLLYMAFWLALLMAFLLVAAWLVQQTDMGEEKQPELRDGHSGAGLYDKDDWRIDMGDPNDT